MRAVSGLGHAFGLAAGPLVAMGMARFAYALLLPAMRTDLQWTYTEAGAMNTANAVGYLAGALGSAWLVGLVRLRLLFLTGLVLTAASVLACAATSAFAALAALRFLGGFCGAVTFVTGAALVMHAGAHLSASRATLRLGIYVAGGGIGIAVSGLVLPPVLAGFDWRTGWLALGIVSLVALVRAALATWIGDGARPTIANGVAWRRRPAAARGVRLFGSVCRVHDVHRRLLQPGSARCRRGVLDRAGLAGAASTPRGPAARPVRGGRGLSLAGHGALGGAVPVVMPGPRAIASGVLFGGAFLATRGRGHGRGPPRDAAVRLGRAVGALTTVFALGQRVGPVLTGALSDQNGVRAGLAVSAVLLAVGALVALAQPAD